MGDDWWVQAPGECAHLVSADECWLCEEERQYRERAELKAQLEEVRRERDRLADKGSQLLGRIHSDQARVKELEYNVRHLVRERDALRAALTRVGRDEVAAVARAHGLRDQVRGLERERQLLRCERDALRAEVQFVLEQARRQALEEAVALFQRDDDYTPSEPEWHSWEIVDAIRALASPGGGSDGT